MFEHGLHATDVVRLSLIAVQNSHFFNISLNRIHLSNLEGAARCGTKSAHSVYGSLSCDIHVLTSIILFIIIIV